MIIKSLKRKNVATVPSGYSGQERRFAQSVSEELDTLSGRRGNVIDRAVTFRDLLSTGVLRSSKGILGNGTEVIGPNEDGDGAGGGATQLPTKPDNFNATGGFGVIFLEWTLPEYVGHDYVEIFRLRKNNPTDPTPTLAQAQAVGVYTRYYGDLMRFTDTNVGNQENWYYWIRAVNIDGVTGPFESSAGVNATTALDYIFVSGLIDSILDDDINSLGLNTTLGAIDSTLTSVTNINNAQQAKYAVKIDNNGHVSGFGLLSTANDSTPTSSFVVAADRFAIAAPFNSSAADVTAVGTNIPFKVFTTATNVGGVSVPAGVYIQDAFIHNAQITTALIRDAAITSAKINDLSADKITSGNITIDNSNNIAIRQGKSFFNGTASGFFLGNLNGAGVFNLGDGTNFVKFDGTNLEVTGASITEASIGTLKIQGEAVTAPRSTGGSVSTTFGGTNREICNIPFTMPAIGAGQSAGVMVLGTVNCFSSNSTGTSVRIKIFKDNTQIGSIGMTWASDGVSGCALGKTTQGSGGSATYRLKASCDNNNGGSSTKAGTISGTLLILVGKK
ncbi:MAG TPA: hypothetical protein DCW74_06610 [Alteromonas australica]|uniref:Tip attachment protein J central straight fiber domain-containing protein n=1 Tax=Alteromonas australica TaxID=589873 RepID=A0A350P275_9ALTE|nr:hypothetical protein [Alteromonas australica]